MDQIRHFTHLLLSWRCFHVRSLPVWNHFYIVSLRISRWRLILHCISTAVERHIDYSPLRSLWDSPTDRRRAVWQSESYRWRSALLTTPCSPLSPVASPVHYGIHPASAALRDAQMTPVASAIGCGVWAVSWDGRAGQSFPGGRQGDCGWGSDGTDGGHAWEARLVTCRADWRRHLSAHKERWNPPTPREARSGHQVCHHCHPHATEKKNKTNQTTVISIWRYLSNFNQLINHTGNWLGQF